MASFSFGTGNAAKLLRIPLYVAGRLGTLLIPRGSRWVFGCGAGVGDGSLALQRFAAEIGHDTVWLTSSAREERDAAALGIRTVRRDGVRGWWETARGGVLIVTHGLGDVNRYASFGGFVVQLWHGIPLKRIGLDSPATTQVPQVPGRALLRLLIAAMYRSSVHSIRLLPAASHRARGRLESAFALGYGRVVVTGEPRVDVLSAGPADSRRLVAAELLRRIVGDLPPGARTILYAPTWRDGATDPAVPTAEVWVRIVQLLERSNAVLLIRSHPLGEGNYVPPLPSGRVRSLGSGVLTDVTPVLPAVNVLVTDYSSLAYDVGLLAMPVLFLAPDIEDYARTRGFYGRFEDLAGADVARGWDEVLPHLADVLNDEGEFARRSALSAAVSAEMHDFRDGRNTERLYLAIRSRGIPAPKGAP